VPPRHAAQGQYGEEGERPAESGAPDEEQGEEEEERSQAEEEGERSFGTPNR